MSRSPASRTQPRALTLLVGLPADRFLERCWPARAHVHHGPLARLEHLVGDPSLESVERFLRTVVADRVRVWFYEGETQLRTLVVSPDQAWELYRGGRVTVVLDNVRTPAIDEWMRRLAQDLETPIEEFACNAYASPAGIGTRAHFDDTEVFLVQLRGSKRWSITPNAMAFPPVEHMPGSSTPLELLGTPQAALRPDASKTVKHVLRPGSVLFLPRGYWHASDTAAESLALTLTFKPFTWAALVARHLASVLKREPAWREPAHGALATGGRRHGAEHRFRELLATISSELESTDLARCLETTVGVYSVIPPVRLRVSADVRLRSRAASPRLRINSAAGVTELELDEAAARLWAAIARKRGAFMPADIVDDAARPVVVGRFLKALLGAGALRVVRDGSRAPRL